jgi:hypothetical protein
VRRAGDPVALNWVKRRLKCDNADCGRNTFTGRCAAVPYGHRLTQRLREQCASEVAHGAFAVLPWALLVAGSVAGLAANVAVAEPSLIGRVIAAWPSLALTASYELLTR